MPDRALALDLGTTRIKIGLLDPEGRLVRTAVAPAPPPSGEDPIRESDPEAYAGAARSLLEAFCRPFPDVATLAVASQRSTFLLWDRESGRPITPLVSWQDRRAAEWCRRRAPIGTEVSLRTGLLLSPHYAGPKLASILEGEAVAQAAVSAGRALFGTLETWIAWRWSGGRVHRTDLTMAARTLLADPFGGDWSPEMLGAFGVPREILPRIEATAGAAEALDGGLVLRATLADQASGALAVVGDDPAGALVNLGTGCFVLRPTGSEPKRVPRYLSGPILGGRRTLFALEGTINAGGSVADRFDAGPTPLPERDPAPEAFCLPDAAGVGSPHWSSETPFTLSAPAQLLPPEETRRVVLEGIVFRVREILDDLGAAGPPARVLLSGGLSREPFVAQALAACLGRAVEVVEETEATLLGAARLAAGLPPFADPRRSNVRPGARGSYLSSKYERWRSWLRNLGLGLRSLRGRPRGSDPSPRSEP